MGVKHMEHKGFKKVEQPEQVKMEKPGESVRGKFLAIEESAKYAESYAVTFRGKGEKLQVVFVNKMARDLFARAKVKNGQEFILEFLETRTSEKDMVYNVYELHVAD